MGHSTLALPAIILINNSTYSVIGSLGGISAFSMFSMTYGAVSTIGWYTLGELPSANCSLLLNIGGSYMTDGAENKIISISCYRYASSILDCQQLSGSIKNKRVSKIKITYDGSKFYLCIYVNNLGGNIIIDAFYQTGKITFYDSLASVTGDDVAEVEI